MSASTARAASNALNARKSTGPVTLEGRERASRNALRHGLTAKAVVLPGESQEDYAALHSAYTKEWAPASEYEKELLSHMVDCWWRLQRAHRVEAAFLAQRTEAISEANGDLQGDDALAMIFSDPAESAKFRLFLRYLTGAEKAWQAALKAFRQAQGERMRREAESDMMQSMLEMAAERAAAAKAAGTVGFQMASGTGGSETKTHSGFVSQPAGPVGKLAQMTASGR